MDSFTFWKWGAKKNSPVKARTSVGVRDTVNPDVKNQSMTVTEVHEFDPRDGKYRLIKEASFAAASHFNAATSGSSGNSKVQQGSSQQPAGFQGTVPLQFAVGNTTMMQTAMFGHQSGNPFAGHFSGQHFAGQSFPPSPNAFQAPSGMAPQVSGYYSNVPPQVQCFQPNNQGMMPVYPMYPMVSQQSPMVPQQSQMVPQQTQMVQQHTQMVPQQIPMVPQQISMVPQQSSMVPQQSSMVPQQSSMVPQQSPMVPQQYQMVPQQNPMVPQQSSMVPQQSSMVPQQHLMVPQQNPMVPQQNVTFCQPQQAQMVPNNATFFQPMQMAPAQNTVQFQNQNPQMFHQQPQGFSPNFQSNQTMFVQNTQMQSFAMSGPPSGVQQCYQPQTGQFYMWSGTNTAPNSHVQMPMQQNVLGHNSNVSMGQLSETIVAASENFKSQLSRTSSNGTSRKIISIEEIENTPPPRTGSVFPAIQFKQTESPAVSLTGLGTYQSPQTVASNSAVVKEDEDILDISEIVYSSDEEEVENIAEKLSETIVASSPNFKGNTSMKSTGSVGNKSQRSDMFSSPTSLLANRKIPVLRTESPLAMPVFHTPTSTAKNTPTSLTKQSASIESSNSPSKVPGSVSKTFEPEVTGNQLIGNTSEKDALQTRKITASASEGNAPVEMSSSNVNLQKQIGLNNTAPMLPPGIKKQERETGRLRPAASRIPKNALAQNGSASQHIEGNTSIVLNQSIANDAQPSKFFSATQQKVQGNDSDASRVQQNHQVKEHVENQASTVNIKPTKQVMAPLANSTCLEDSILAQADTTQITGQPKVLDVHLDVKQKHYAEKRRGSGNESLLNETSVPLGNDSSFFNDSIMPQGDTTQAVAQLKTLDLNSSQMYGRYQPKKHQKAANNTLLNETSVPIGDTSELYDHSVLPMGDNSIGGDYTLGDYTMNDQVTCDPVNETSEYDYTANETGNVGEIATSAPATDEEWQQIVEKDGDAFDSYIAKIASQRANGTAITEDDTLDAHLNRFFYSYADEIRSTPELLVQATAVSIEFIYKCLVDYPGRNRMGEHLMRQSFACESRNIHVLSDVLCILEIQDQTDDAQRRQIEEAFFNIIYTNGVSQ